MADIAIAIATVDRTPKRNYLAQTLLNLARAGVWKSSRLSEVVIVDSGVGEDWPSRTLAAAQAGAGRIGMTRPGDCRIVLSQARRSAKQTFATALFEGAQDARWVIFIEDDIDVCADFVDSVGRWLDDNVRPDPCVYVMGGDNSAIKSAHERGESAWLQPPPTFWGLQCVVMSAPVARDVGGWMEQHPIFTHADGRPDDNAHDLELQRWAADRKAPTFVAAAPSFVQHVGDDSAINPERTWRVTFPTWPGVDWTYDKQKKKQKVNG